MSRHFYNKSLSLTRFLVFLLLLGNIGCQKELSKDTLGSGGVIGGSGGNSSGGAAFVLVPSGSNCSDAAVAGTFEAGINLGIDAVMTVTVNVTKTGDWSYSTALVNGFAFAGAGNFPATGVQVITLQAVGKPVNTGNSNFNLKIGGGTCFISVAVLPAGSGGTTADFYYKATIDGVNYNQSVTLTNGYEPGTGMSGSDDVIFGGGINYSNPPAPAGKTEFGIGKGIMHHYMTATPAMVKAFFTPGTYPYANVDFSVDGVQVSWTDPSGTNDNIWDTRDGTKDQTGSTFKIISAQDFTDAVGDYYVIVKAQFNCNLYNQKTGAKKILTNGEAIVAFAMF